MTSNWREALEATLRKWEKIAKSDDPCSEYDVTSCPACIYARTQRVGGMTGGSCAICPVSDGSGAFCCKAYERWDDYEVFEVGPFSQALAAKGMVTYLTKILEVGGRDDES